jgi:hypothetical protein
VSFLLCMRWGCVNTSVIGKDIYIYTTCGHAMRI